MHIKYVLCSIVSCKAFVVLTLSPHKTDVSTWRYATNPCKTDIFYRVSLMAPVVTMEVEVHWGMWLFLLECRGDRVTGNHTCSVKIMWSIYTFGVK